MEDLKLPFAMFRNDADAVVYDLSPAVGLYWSSSPYDSSNPNYVSYLKLDTNTVYAYRSNYSVNRADALSVRCFKNMTDNRWQNSDVELTVSYDTESNQVTDGYSWDGASYSSTV